MFKRRWGWTFVGLCWVTLACGRSTRNGAGPDDSSMAGAGPDDGDLSTSSGGSIGLEPSAGGSRTSGGDAGSGGSGTGGTGASSGRGGSDSMSTGGSSTSGSSTGDGGTGALATGGDTGTGANAGTGGDASGGSNAGGGGSNGSSGSTFCQWGTYDTDLTDDELTCQPWTVCEPGTFEQEFGGATRDRVCEPCPEGTWSDQVWETSCAPATLCDFGEQEDVELTPTHDRTCVVADVFGMQPFTDQVDTGALVVTDQGAYLSVRETFAGKALVLRYSLDGEYLGSWGADEDQSVIGDLATIGDDLVVAAVKLVPDPELNYTEPGFVKKFSADGTLLWEAEFDDEPSDHFTAIGVASHDDTVYAVARVMEVECDASTCTGGASKLVLRVLDADGNEVLSETLEDDSTVSDILGVAVASTGKVHVAVTRQSLRFADDCDQISEEDDPTYYYYNCVVGVATWSDSLLLVDGTELLGEYSLGDRGRFTRLVAAGANGSAYALARVDPANHLLVRMDAGGELLLDDLLDLEGEWLETLAVTDTGLLLVGFSNHGPALLRADPNGQIQSREVLEEVAKPWEISGLREAADGRVFLGGAASSAAFVVPWPE